MVAREKSVSEVGSDADSVRQLLHGLGIKRYGGLIKAFQNLANDLHYIDLRGYSRGSTSEDALEFSYWLMRSILDHDSKIFLTKTLNCS